jgi:hypothetical protein
MARLEEAFKRARGNGVRVKELLASETGLEVPYSTLTRWIREAELRDPPRRSGECHQAPGEEMQHDTSPHRVVLSGKAVTAQCVGLTFAYSRALGGLTSLDPIVACNPAPSAPEQLVLER